MAKGSRGFEREEEVVAEHTATLPIQRTVHPYDLRLLTAKAISFRSLVRFEASDHAKLTGEARKTLLWNLTHLQSFAASDANDQDISAALEAIAQALEILLHLCFDAQQVTAFVDHFRNEAAHYGSIHDELRSWIESMREYSIRYLPLNSTMKSEVFLGAPEWCDPPLETPISAVTQAVDVGRQITLYLNSKMLDFDGYFEIPGILSHEFWCHSLSSIQPEEGDDAEPHVWCGCDPEDSWEEGWMDFIQNLVLRSHDFPVPRNYHSWLLPSLHKACSGYEVQRADPAKSYERSRGWGAALLAQKFFRQHYPAYSPDDLLIEFSVKINSFNRLPEVKRRIVDCFLKHLAYSERDQSVQASLDQLVRGRKELARLLSAGVRVDKSTHSASIDAWELFKAMENW